MLIDDGRWCCVTDIRPFTLCLKLNNIERRRTKVRKPRTGGFIEQNRVLCQPLELQLGMSGKYYGFVAIHLTIYLLNTPNCITLTMLPG